MHSWACPIFKYEYWLCFHMSDILYSLWYSHSFNYLINLIGCFTVDSYSSALIIWLRVLNPIIKLGLQYPCCLFRRNYSVWQWSDVQTVKIAKFSLLLRSSTWRTCHRQSFSFVGLPIGASTLIVSVSFDLQPFCPFRGLRLTSGTSFIKHLRVPEFFVEDAMHLRLERIPAVTRIVVSSTRSATIFRDEPRTLGLFVCVVSQVAP